MSQKQQLLNQMRRVYGLQTSSRVHLTKNEMEAIVSQITGGPKEWTSVQTFFEDYLASKGYRSQVTVDTHPTYRNLNWLIEEKQSASQKKTSPKSATSKTKTNSTRTISFDLNQFLDKISSIEFTKDKVNVTFQD
jgi:hypothetical protein